MCAWILIQSKYSCIFPPILAGLAAALINVPLRGFSYPRSHKQIRGSDSMKLFHFYSNALGTNFSAEIRFLGGPDGNMRSGWRIKVAWFLPKIFQRVVCILLKLNEIHDNVWNTNPQMVSSGNPAAIIRLGHTSFVSLRKLSCKV